MIHDAVSCEHILHWTLYSRAREFPEKSSSIKEIYVGHDYPMNHHSCCSETQS